MPGGMRPHSRAGAGRAGAGGSTSCCPAVLVLRPIVDQRQEPGRRQALDEAVEESLGLGIDPVQVLTDQQQRLLLAFAQEEALERIERALASLRWIERQERTVRWQSV